MLQDTNLVPPVLCRNHLANSIVLHPDYWWAEGVQSWSVFSRPHDAWASLRKMSKYTHSQLSAPWSCWIRSSGGWAQMSPSSIHITHLTLTFGHQFWIFLSKILGYNILNHICSSDYFAREKRNETMKILAMTLCYMWYVYETRQVLEAYLLSVVFL